MPIINQDYSENVVFSGDFARRAVVAPVAGADYVEFLDATDGLVKRCLISAVSGGGGVTDGDKGDITVSSSGTVWTIDSPVPTARLGTGTADNSTFLRGDQTWATVPGASAITTIDFGAFPGASDTSLAITGQTGIDSASVVTAWLQPADTDDHTADEHRVETMSVMAGNVIAGTGFTIYAQNTSQLNEPLTDAGMDTFRSTSTTSYGNAGRSIGGRGTRIYGKWTVAWRWS